MGKKNILRSGFFNADRVTLLTVTAVFAVMAVLVYTGNVGRQIQNMLTSVACYIVLAVSLNLVVGLLGELSPGSCRSDCSPAVRWRCCCRASCLRLSACRCAW